MVTIKQYERLLKQNEKLKKQNEELKDDLKSLIDWVNYYRKCYNQMRDEFYKHKDRVEHLTDKLKEIRILTLSPQATWKHQRKQSSI